MNSKGNRFIFFFIIGCLCIPIITGCFSDDESCSISGSSVNIGRTTGGTFSADLGNNHLLYFNNTNLNFSNGYLKDVGDTDCLEDITTWPGSTATSIAYSSGHGYIIKFSDNTYARFIAGGYSNGSVNITYDYPFTPQ